MRGRNLIKSVCVVVLVAAMMAIVGVVFASDKPDPTTPPTVDGILDEGVYSFYSRYEAGGDLAPGNLYVYSGSNFCYYAFVVDDDYNDNVFADDDRDYLEQAGWPEPGGGGQGHGFEDLEESDYGQFTIDCSGLAPFAVTLDYVQYCDDETYESGNDQSGGDEGCEFAPPDGIAEVATSLYWNMTTSEWITASSPYSDYADYGYASPQEHSPPYKYNDVQGQYWEWRMIYEFSVERPAGEDCCLVTQAGAHNSPEKKIDDTTAVTLLSLAAAPASTLAGLLVGLGLAVAAGSFVWLRRRTS